MFETFLERMLLRKLKPGDTPVSSQPSGKVTPIADLADVPWLIQYARVINARGRSSSTTCAGALLESGCRRAQC